MAQHNQTKAIRSQMKERSRKNIVRLYFLPVVLYDSAEDMSCLADDSLDVNIYSPVLQPNSGWIHQQIAELEGAEDGIATELQVWRLFFQRSWPSKQGDHIISRRLFGSHTILYKNIFRSGVLNPSYFNMNEPESTWIIDSSHYKMLYVETPSNPGLISLTGICGGIV